MSLKLLIVLVSISCLFLEASSIPMNNIGFLAKGYNIFKGNPLAHNIDPGFTKVLFDFKYDGRVTADQRYDIPIGTDIEKQRTCTLKFDTEEVTTERSYYDKLSVYASVEGGFLGASFSASTDYKKIKDEKTIKNYVHTITTGECVVYKATIDDFYPPVLDANFKRAVMEKLPEKYESDEYFKFINSYGTHFVSQVLMGSRMSVINSLKEKDRTELITKGVDIKASAGYSAFKVSGGVSKESKNTELFKNKIIKTETHCIGSDPPKDGDANSWANQVVKEPMPIQYTLMPIYELIDMANLHLTEADSRVKGIRDNVKRALDDYCSNLRKQDSSISCNAPPAEKLPAYSGQCALCAQNCGGDYSIESGTLAAGKESKNFQTLPEECRGKIGSYDLGKEGAKLCCMPQSKEKKTESCRLCESCGGEFTSSRGKVAKGLKTDNWAFAYDKECSGNLRSRVHTKSGFELCCMSSSPCVLCTSCGGDYHETGVLGLGDNKKQYKTMGDKCQGPLKEGQEFSNGLRLCCAKSGSPVPESSLFLSMLRPKKK